jgi:hypothetical protein
MGRLLVSDRMEFRVGRKDYGDGGRDNLPVTRTFKLLMSFSSFPSDGPAEGQHVVVERYALGLRKDGGSGVCRCVLDGFGLEWRITSIEKEGE